MTFISLQKPIVLCYCADMEIALPNVRSDAFATEFLHGWVQLWVNSCNSFREWEREELFKKKPSREALERHKKLAKSLIRTAQMLRLVMEDPEYPAREFLPEIRGKLMQLQDAWDMLHNNPM